MVRCRKLPHVKELARLVDQQRAVITTRDSDYPYRFIVTRRELCSLMVTLANSVDYTNYKDHMAKGHPAGFMRVLHEVWALLADWQAGRPNWERD
jgi:hypothetical protein